MVFAGGTEVGQPGKIAHIGKISLRKATFAQNLLFFTSGFKLLSESYSRVESGDTAFLIPAEAHGDAQFDEPEDVSVLHIPKLTTKNQPFPISSTFAFWTSCMNGESSNSLELLGLRNCANKKYTLLNFRRQNNLRKMAKVEISWARCDNPSLTAPAAI